MAVADGRLPPVHMNHMDHVTSFCSSSDGCIEFLIL